MINNYIDIISNTPLFTNVNNKDVNSLLSCMNSYIEDYKKKSFIFLEGNAPNGIGIVLEGSADIIKEDIFGNRIIIGKLNTGDIFGEVFACALVDELPISVEAATDCKILLMDYKRIITTCSSSCKFHNTLIKNMLRILAEKNLNLNSKNDILASRNMREKIMKYLESIGKQKNSFAFDIPFSRQELADYLSVNRSAMTKELSKMEEEGLITFSKNHFTIC